MKKTKPKKVRRGFFYTVGETFSEMLGELVVFLALLAAGVLIYFLLPKSIAQKIDTDDLIWLGFPLLLVALVIFWIVDHYASKQKKRQLTLNRQRYYKAFHKMYGCIDHLYDDLKDSVSDIEKKDDIITVCQNTHFMTIEKAVDGFRTRTNGSKDAVFQPDEMIYQYVMQFVGGQSKVSAVWEVSDDYIFEIAQNGIYFTDVWDQAVCISFVDCADEHAENSIGVRDSNNFSYTFCTPDVQTRIMFDSSFVKGKKTHPLYGSRKKRFENLQEQILKYGYTTVELRDK